MECIHNAYIEVVGGKKCLLCGAFIPENQEQPAEPQKQPEKAAPAPKAGKPAGKKTTPKTGK